MRTASQLFVTARTYNQTTTGTFGQFVPAVTPAESTGVGIRPLQILQVEESNRFRTNIAVAETTGKPATVVLTVTPPDSRVSANIQLDLAANEYRQLNSILKSLSITSPYNVRVSVKVTAGEGKVTAGASVIDQLTQDPTFVPAQ